MFFKEFSDVGFNLGTVSSLILTIITCLQARALAIQRDEVWSKKKGESISNPLFTYFIFYHLATLYYGFYQQSLVIILTGILFIYYFQIVRGLWKFEGANSEVKCISVAATIGLYFFLIPVPIEVAYKSLKLNQTEIVYAIFTVTAGIPLFHQAMTLYETKKPGNLRPELMFVLIMKLLFWLIFAIYKNDSVFFWLTPPALLATIATLSLWYYYKIEEQKSAAA